MRRCSSCPTCLTALRALAAAARARLQAKVIGVTGSVGKTGTKEALRLALSQDGETHASVASYNNHWGVPLSLARCPAERALRGVRNRHEPRRRDRAADAAGAPARRDHHHDRAGAPRILRLARGRSPTPRRRSFSGSSRRRRGASIATIRNSRGSSARAKGAGVARVVSFGEHAEAEARLIKCALHAGLLDRAGATFSAHDVTYKLGAPGRHVVHQFAGGARGGGAGRRRSGARRARARRTAARGRPRRAHRRSICRAAPRCSSTRATTPIRPRCAAALALLGQAEVGPRGRRIAVLGDMLELGPRGAELHRGLARAGASPTPLIWCSAAGR